MAIHLSKDKWNKLQQSWIKVSNILKRSTNKALDDDVKLINDILFNTTNNSNNAPDLSKISSNEFNNLMNEIEIDVKTNDTVDLNHVNNEEYQQLSKNQKEFITKPVCLIFLYLQLCLVCNIRYY